MAPAALSKVLEVRNLHVVFGIGQQLVQTRSHVYLVGAAGRPGDFRQLVELGFEAPQQHVRLNPGLRQDGRRESIFLLEERRQQVFDVDLLVAVTRGFTLRRPDRLLQFLRETIDVHSLYFRANRGGADIPIVFLRD